MQEARFLIKDNVMQRTAQNYSERANALNIAREEGAGQQEPSPDFNDGARMDSSHANEAVKESAGDKEKKENKKTLNPFAVFMQANMLQDMPFVCAIGASILDWIFNLIFAPTIILPITFSIITAIFTFMMMQLAKFSEKVKVHSRFGIKIGLIIAGGICGGIPGLDFIPLSVATVLIVYGITLWERANAEKSKV
jgi:hypothetical protein